MTLEEQINKAFDDQLEAERSYLSGVIESNISQIKSLQKIAQKQDVTIKELKEKVKRVEDMVDEFDNHSNCYADTRSINLIGEDIEGDIVMAMTKDRLRDLTLKALE